MNIGIWGEGYTGKELLFLLSENPLHNVVYMATSKKHEGKIDKAKIAVLALPHIESMRIVPGLLGSGKRVIDLSGSYRLQPATLYDEFYHFHHQHPEFLPRAIYGLPELNREQIRNAQLVANPGCYATAIILALLPLAQIGLLKMAKEIRINAVSGYSGAGKDAKMPERVTPYAWGRDGREHQHVPEIEQALCLNGQIHFFPSIAPWLRGIEATIQLALDVKNIRDLYQEFYRHEKFVRIAVENQVSLENVIKTNFCDMAVESINGQTKIEVAIDNLGKGAAGQAVQNLNLMCGIEETLVY